MPLKRPNHKILIASLSSAIDKVASSEQTTEIKKPTSISSIGTSLIKKKKGKPPGPILINTARLLTL